MISVITDSFKIAMAQSIIATMKTEPHWLQFHSDIDDTPLFAIKINPENVIQGVKNYKTGKVDLKPYSKDVPDLYSTPFFTTAETLYEQNVYKVISGQGFANSMPTHKEYEPKMYSDGLSYKYMYNIPSHIAYKFSNDYYVPVLNEITTYKAATLSDVPPNGHGFNALYELSSTAVIINVKVPGNLFAQALSYKALKILKNINAAENIIYRCIRCVPERSGDSPYKVGDKFTITEGGVGLDAQVLAKLKDGTLLISGDKRITYLTEANRQNYVFSGGANYRIVLPDDLNGLELTIDKNKIKTIESKINLTVTTIIDI